MLSHNLTQDQNYNFSAEPKVVKPRAKYREAPQNEDENGLANTNIMFDKRVVRGNTYAQAASNPKENIQPLKNGTNKPRPKHLSPSKFDNTDREAIHADVSTPRPVEGRKHTEVQTDENIEYLTDRPPEYEKDAQTDFYIDRPVNRLFVPQKIGEDKETQIWEGELFDFDYEVEPILQVLIGKTLEQGRMEVLEEEEHKILKDEQKRYDELRYAELTEAQKMEAEERRKLDENERRRKQHRLKNEQGITSHKKFISRLLAKECLGNVSRNSFNMLREQGNFQNAFDFELHHGFLSYVYNDVVSQQDEGLTIGDSIAALNAVISHNVAKAHADAVQREKDRKRQVIEDAERKEREKIERRRKRAEARAQRDEDERLKVLKEKILTQLIVKGEQKAGIWNQVLSDIDSLGRGGNTVGLLGGLVGELLLVLSTLDELKNVEETDPLAVLKTIEITKESIQKVVKYVVEELVKEGKIEVGVTGEIEAQLAAIEADLNLENLHTKPAKAEAIREVLNASVGSYVLSALQKNAEKLKINNEYNNLIVNALIDVVLSTEESARKVKLVKAQTDYSQDPRLETLNIFTPEIEQAPLFNLADAKGVKTKKSKKDREAKDKEGKEAEQTVTVDAPVTATEEEAKPALTAAEVDYEDLVSIFPCENPELRVLVHQRPVSIQLRRNILIFLSTLIKELDMKEIDVLKKVNSKAEEVEKALTQQFPKKINVFVFDRS